MTDYNFRGISQTDRKPGDPGRRRAAVLQQPGLCRRLRLERRPGDASPTPRSTSTPASGRNSATSTSTVGVMAVLLPGEKQLIDTGGRVLDAEEHRLHRGLRQGLLHLRGQPDLGANVFYAWDWLGTGATGTYASVTAKYNAALPGRPLGLRRVRPLLARHAPISRSGRRCRRPTCRTTPTGTPASPTPGRT
jgi:hypothetical protein